MLTRRVILITVFALAGAVVSAPVTLAQPAPAAGTTANQRALLDQYCVTCHNERLEVGGLSLQNLDIGDVADHADVWEKVVQKLRAGSMPPRPRPRPDTDAYNGFRSWLEAQLDAAAEAAPNAGRTEALHRISRTEYRNVIRDLLDVDVDVSALLPADDTSYGFDNIAGCLASHQR